MEGVEKSGAERERPHNFYNITPYSRVATSTEITAYYRKHDDFRRYSATAEERVRSLTNLYRLTKRYFGKSILDLACGGGVLGLVVEPEGHDYVGVDINPDAIGAAKRYAKEVGSHNRFILGDMLNVKLEGTFDTVALLGNALIHFNTASLGKIMDSLDPHVHRGSFFIVDYRDVVGMLYRREWGKRYQERDGSRTVVSIPQGIDVERGEILIKSESDGKHNLDFGHAIWSPFIIEPLLLAKGWRLAKQYRRRAWKGWLDVYARSETAQP